MPDTFSISMPAEGEADPITISVIASKPGTPLFVELAEPVVTYLHLVATHQLEVGTVQPRAYNRAEVGADKKSGSRGSSRGSKASSGSRATSSGKKASDPEDDD